MAENGVRALLLCVLTPCVLTLFSRTGPEPSRRNISITLNPDRPEPHSGGDLLYVRSVGLNDSLHVLLCSQGAPSLLLVHSNSTEAQLKINWTQFSEHNTRGSLKVEPESSVVYSSVLVFSRLWEYDDVNDTADPVSNLFPPYELQNFTWSGFNLSTLSALLCGTYPQTNGTLCVQLFIFEDWGRSESWPRLLHSPYSFQLVFSLDGWGCRSSHPRFLLELRAVGGAPLDEVIVLRSIDDEYTPSIFKVSQWLSNSSDPGSSSSLGFVQWKPVSYRKPTASLEQATPLRHWSPLRQDPVSTATASPLVLGFYGNDTATTGINVTFGLSGDPFYSETNYISWTLLMGVGQPPLDQFSPLVLTVLAVGLGVPILVLGLGGVWLCVRKYTTSSSSTYEPIN